MGFLRRLLGSHPPTDAAADAPATPAAGGSEPDADAVERAYELDLLRGEQERLDDLRQRQLRYAAHAWQPPAQGGERRADDGDGSPEG